MKDYVMITPAGTEEKLYNLWNDTWWADSGDLETVN